MKSFRLLLVGAVLASVAGLAASTELDTPAPDGRAKVRNVVFVSSFESDSVLRFPGI